MDACSLNSQNGLQEPPSPLNRYVINLAAITFNLKALKKKLPQNTRFMVMVKALAYGTDDLSVARHLISCGVELLGVSYVDEALTLRKAGLTHDLFVIHADLSETDKIVRENLEIGVSDPVFIKKLETSAEKAGKKVKVHLHIDTGMSRLGCRPTEAPSLALKIHHSPWLILEGVMTHFAAADDPQEDPFTLRQAHLFEQALSEIENLGLTIPWKHAANSAAALRFHFPAFNMVRIGLAAYGLHSSPATKEVLELKPAVSLISRLVGINHCEKGATISYGRSYKVEQEGQRIGVLPIGYYDGLHRNYSGKGSVIIHGKKVSMVGRICMDYMMVDLTPVPEAGMGDSVLIFGEDDQGHYLPPEELAEKGGSIVYELITCLGPRLQREFIYKEN